MIVSVTVLMVSGSAAADLVAHWKLDEGQGTVASDSSGNGLDGILRGNPTWVPGVVGGALRFDGSSDYVEVPDNPLLALTTQITIAAWTYMNPNASGEMAIVSKGGWAAYNLPYELTEERGAVIFWQFYDHAGRDGCSPNSPSAGEWHHLAATYDGQIFKCYIDGLLGEAWAYAGTMPTNTAALTIGRRSTGGTFYNGMIDDVRIYNNALSSVEIAPLAGPSKVIYVDDDAAGANDGSSWYNAYRYLQDALSDANDAQKPVEVRVAQGIYTPDCGDGYVRGDKQVKFLLKSGVILKGGLPVPVPTIPMRGITEHTRQS